jgi:hypothetical protein
MTSDKNLVLDLDNTLIFMCERTIDTNKLNSEDILGLFHGMPIIKRPGLESFLLFCFEHFGTVSIWTAATKDYAEWISEQLMLLLNNRYSFKYVLSNEKCMRFPAASYSAYTIKPLSTLYDIDTSFTSNNTFLVDDLHFNGLFNPMNILVVHPFTEQSIMSDEKDTFLNELVEIFITQILFCNDVKLVLSKKSVNPRNRVLFS